MIRIKFHRRALCAGDDVYNGVYTIEMPDDAVLGDLMYVLRYGGNGNSWPLQWNHDGWDIYSNTGIIASVSNDLKHVEYYGEDANTLLSGSGIKWVFGEYKGDIPDNTTLKWRFMDE